MDLIGLDIGFSASRRTSGVARLSGSNLTLGRATSSWESRVELIGSSVKADIAAIDGPLLRELNWAIRACERIFTVGLFQRRCKPGLSHVRGTGHEFREAGQKTAKQLSDVVSGHNLASEFPRVWESRNLVEAFPNAFLGVLIPGGRFSSIPRLRRGEKFDWLYEQCCDTLAFSIVVDAIGSEEMRDRLTLIEANQDHEERAALVCLLTAAAVVEGRYTAVGDEQCGYFFLPPWESWAEWARNELDTQRRRITSIEVWKNGECFGTSDTLTAVTYRDRDVM